MNDMLRRQKATQATLERFRDKPFSWVKANTCVHLARFHMRQMGHKPPAVPQIRSALGARRQLDLRGWADVGDMMDSMFPRIPSANLALGDLAMMKSGDGFGAIVLSLGGKVLGWHEDFDGMTVLEPLEFAGAWRL